MKQLQVLILILFSQGIFAAPAALLQAISVDNQQWPARYELNLQIPKHHHAYLDSGVENAYLPIVVDPKHQLSNQGIRIDKLEKPQGVFDQEVQARVLRNQGMFTVWLSALVIWLLLIARQLLHYAINYVMKKPIFVTALVLPKLT